MLAIGGIVNIKNALELKSASFLLELGRVAVMAPPVRYCIPWEHLCNLEEGSLGSSTYTQHGYIFSLLAGCMMKRSKNCVLLVSAMIETESQLLPAVGAIVTCKVSSIGLHFAKVHILYAGSILLKNFSPVIIFKKDI